MRATAGRPHLRAVPSAPDPAPPVHAPAELATAVRASILALAERFLPDQAPDREHSWQLVVDDLPPWQLRVSSRGCAIAPGTPEDPDVTFRTDAATWLAIVSGATDAVGAFQAGRLEVRGDLGLAVALGTMFAPGGASTRWVRGHRTLSGGVGVESLVVGTGPPVLLLHGLAASKVTFVPTLDDLAHDHEVHALDLPGHGSSDKPFPRGDRYRPAWYARVVRDYVRAHDLDRVHVVGNSMGGRIAAELALGHPELVASVIGLSPALPFDGLHLPRALLRPLPLHWAGAAPLPVTAEAIEAGLRRLFHDPARLPEANIRAAVDQACLAIADRGHRLAVAAAGRALATDRGRGRRGLWRRLAGLRVPSLWLFGAADPLVAAANADRVRAVLPSAEVECWDDCGHVPQFEIPDRTHGRVREFLARAS